MTATRNINGSWTISTIHAGRLVSCTYFYYTKREAMRQFKADLPAS